MLQHKIAMILWAGQRGMLLKCDTSDISKKNGNAPFTGNNIYRAGKDKGLCGVVIA